MQASCRYRVPAALIVLTAVFLAHAIGCGGRDDGAGEVVLYTSLNEPAARAVIVAFEEETGVRVVLQADTERDKTVGLVRTLIEERNRPRADVFWNSETANTERLKGEGVLERLEPAPANAALIPSQFNDPDGYWFGFAARARVLIVNTDLVPEEDRPTSMWDLVDPRWRGKGAIVRPVTGTTLTHIAALHHVIGDDETERFLAGVKENECHLPPGNGRLAQLVGEGRIHFGFTDTSDYRLVKNEGRPVDAIYPDQDGIGALVIPNTVARIRGGPNPENARLLIDFLLSERAEEILAHHQRGHIPLKPGVSRPDDVLSVDEFVAMPVDFARIGAEVEQRMIELDERFQ
ncbi:MAG: extracellular solute-binding protein [Phycisphaeraceae bacterium]|nr:MAG: extracellular solute-binding protein [Phycisphaeraceae bacterium]